MTALLALSLLVSIALGVVSVRALAPPAVALRWPLVLSLGAGLGAGLSALLFFAWMIAFGPGRGFVVAEAILAGAVMLASLRWKRGEPGAADDRHDLRPPTVLVVGLLLVLGAAGAAFASGLMWHPHGEWDAWMNWNLKARMFFRGGTAWRAAFSAALPWSHPDYPVLVPTLVARSWFYAGHETQLGPALVAATFTFGTVALLATALARLRGTGQGLLGGLVLLGTPFFIAHGTTLYADVPLGYFFLATFVGLALDARYGAGTTRFALLAGTMAGLSMVTKNEGLLFAIAVAGGLVLFSRRSLRGFALGMLPLLLLTLGYKAVFAPENDLISTLGADRTLGNLTSPDRYYMTLREYAVHIASFGSNGIGSLPWVLVAYLLGVGISRAELDRPWVRAGAVALALVMAGHFGVFVTMAHELARLLASSLDRLLLQLWPAALFLFLMVARMPNGKPEPPSHARQ